MSIIILEFFFIAQLTFLNRNTADTNSQLYTIYNTYKFEEAYYEK